LNIKAEIIQSGVQSNVQIAQHLPKMSQD